MITVIHQCSESALDSSRFEDLYHILSAVSFFVENLSDCCSAVDVRLASSIGKRWCPTSRLCPLHQGSWPRLMQLPLDLRSSTRQASSPSCSSWLASNAPCSASRFNRSTNASKARAATAFRHAWSSNLRQTDSGEGLCFALSIFFSPRKVKLSFILIS